MDLHFSAFFGILRAMPALRLIRHEKFAREYVKNGVAGIAYAKAYDRRHIDGTAYVNGCRLLKHANINMCLCELRNQAMKRADITIDKILSDYQFALEMGKEQSKPDAIVKAAEAQAKLVGMLRERVEAGNVGDFDSMDTIQEILTSVTEQAGPDAALALAKAFGLEPINDISQDPPSDSVN